MNMSENFRNLDIETSAMLIIGLILNQSVSSRQVWKNVSLLRSRVEEAAGGFSFEVLEKLGVFYIEALIRKDGRVLHRFPGNMANYIYQTSVIVNKTFHGDARKIWLDGDKVLADDRIVERLCELSGIGRHKAIQGLFMLSLIFPIEVSAKYGNYIESACPDFLNNYQDDFLQLFRYSSNQTITK